MFADSMPLASNCYNFGYSKINFVRQKKADVHTKATLSFW